ncbi:MAG: hypothetical protein AB7P04_05595 [Bacteriovoracia bacterium]
MRTKYIALIAWVVSTGFGALSAEASVNAPQIHQMGSVLQVSSRMEILSQKWLDEGRKYVRDGEATDAEVIAGLEKYAAVARAFRMRVEAAMNEPDQTVAGYELLAKTWNVTRALADELPVEKTNENRPWFYNAQLLSEYYSILNYFYRGQYEDPYDRPVTPAPVPSPAPPVQPPRKPVEPPKGPDLARLRGYAQEMIGLSRSLVLDAQRETQQDPRDPWKPIALRDLRDLESDASRFSQDVARYRQGDDLSGSINRVKSSYSRARGPVQSANFSGFVRGNFHRFQSPMNSADSEIRR